MENEIDYKINTIKKIKEKIKDYKKTLISILFILVIILLFSIYLNFQRHQKILMFLNNLLKLESYYQKKKQKNQKIFTKKLFHKKINFILH